MPEGERAEGEREGDMPERRMTGRETPKEQEI